MSFAPFLLITSTSASTLGPASRMVESLSSSSRLEEGSSPASSLNGCSSGFTEAGITSATDLLTSLGEAGAFHQPVFLASRRRKSCSFLDWSFIRASSILGSDSCPVWFHLDFGSWIFAKFLPKNLLSFSTFYHRSLNFPFLGILFPILPPKAFLLH